MDEADALVAVRRQKLEALRKQGLEPYGRRFDKSEPLAALAAAFQDGRAVTTAGRLSAKRAHGKASFADLRDGSGKVQLLIREEQVGLEQYALFETFDLGDFIGVEGTLTKTRTGEVTVEVRRFQILAKSLRPLPEKWHGLKDQELRHRKRYLDLVANPSVRRTFELRSATLTALRATLQAQGYLEVETPMMHPLAGGAMGEPFTTMHNALHLPLYLRLAPELYLKRLLVGGFEKVYELNRSFRNEGLSTRHNPEFTMLEAYAAYADGEGMMRLTQELIVTTAQQVVGASAVTYQGQRLALDGAWKRWSFADEVERAFGVTAEQGVAGLLAKLRRGEIKPRGTGAPQLDTLSRSQVVKLIEELVEPETKGQPVFVVDYWTELSPLSKSRADRPAVAERFELYLGGMELANGYSELNDPVEQRRRFEQQRAVLGGGGRIDEEFVEALEYGMPPAGGLGIGIDRLVMILADQPSIKDVILFPLLKPQADAR
ncbi:MAG: lysine--tRNA ligase [Candidatus Omnitrophica bacterium]|nr:lysine--tRNA ligase [Candidatus Omnitrophota bacterium]